MDLCAAPQSIQLVYLNVYFDLSISASNLCMPQASPIPLSSTTWSLALAIASRLWVKPEFAPASVSQSFEARAYVRFNQSSAFLSVKSLLGLVQQHK